MYIYVYIHLYTHIYFESEGMKPSLCVAPGVDSATSSVCHALSLCVCRGSSYLGLAAQSGVMRAGNRNPLNP